MINTEGFFKDIYKNARENSVIIMDDKGFILQASKSFTSVFGYKSKDIVGNHFRMLFTEADQKLKKPENEVNFSISQGSKSDNNYLVHKDGTPIWVMGESLLVFNVNKERYIVKIIHNIHAQKQLERFLLESTTFIDTIFNSLKDTSLIILDSELKVMKINSAFLKMFALTKLPEEGTRLSQIENSFWKNPDLKKDLMDIIVNRKALKNAQYDYKNKGGKLCKITLDSKLMDGESSQKKILLVIKKVDL